MEFLRCEELETTRLVGRRRGLDRWLARGTSFFLILFVVAAPHSIAVTQIAYSAGLFLWLLRWWLGGVKTFPHRLAWPLLVFLLLSAVSSVFSFAPAESFHAMKKVALLLVGVFWYQNIASFKQVKQLSLLLVLSCLVNVAYTGWQYTYGIGAQLNNVNSVPNLARAGLRERDSIFRVGRHYVSNGSELSRALRDPSLGVPIQLTVVRDVPRKKVRLKVDSVIANEMTEGIADGRLQVSRGHPQRAQGFYDHYVTYSDVLVQIALMAFGLFVACPKAWSKSKVFWGLAVLGMGGALWLTLTRVAMLSFLAGVLLVVFLTCRWRVRLTMVGLVVIAIAVSGLLLQRSRGLGWVNLQDDEGRYRILMLKDGIRLIRQYPWLGIGMESLKTHWKEWHIEAYEKLPLRSHFHCTPLQIAVERGLLTWGSWLWLLTAYGGVLWRLLRLTEKSDGYLRGLVLGLLSAACAFMLGSLTDYNWGDSEVCMIWWMFVGWAMALERLLDQRPDPAAPAPCDR